MTLKRFAILVVISSLSITIWVTQSLKQIDQFTLLSRPIRNSTNTHLSGTYRLDKVERTGYSFRNPFRGAVLTIEDEKEGLSVYLANDSSGLSHQIFKYGKNLWKIDENSVEFQLEPSFASDQIIPGALRSMYEGTFRRDENGDLEVKTIYWQKD